MSQMASNQTVQIARGSSPGKGSSRGTPYRKRRGLHIGKKWVTAKKQQEEGWGRGEMRFTLYSFTSMPALCNLKSGHLSAT
jgi:hypothetical protein